MVFYVAEIPSVPVEFQLLPGKKGRRFATTPHSTSGSRMEPSVLSAQRN